MAKRGRPRKSPELRAAQGLRKQTRDKVTAAPAAPPAPVIPPPEDLLPSAAPEWLSPAALKIWRAVSPGLMRYRLLVDVDSIAFGRYCESLAQYVGLLKLTRRRKLVTETKTKYVDKKQSIDKVFQALTIAEKRLLELEDRFGMNPRERLAMLAKLASGAGQHVPQPPAPAPDAAAAPDGARIIAPSSPASPVGFLSSRTH